MYSDKREDLRSLTYSFGRPKQMNPSWLVDHVAKGSQACCFDRIRYYDWGLAHRSYSPSSSPEGSKTGAFFRRSFSVRSVLDSAAVAEPFSASPIASLTSQLAEESTEADI